MRTPTISIKRRTGKCGPCTEAQGGTASYGRKYRYKFDSARADLIDLVAAFGLDNVVSLAQLASMQLAKAKAVPQRRIATKEQKTLITSHFGSDIASYVSKQSKLNNVKVAKRRTRS